MWCETAEIFLKAFELDVAEREQVDLRLQADSASSRPKIRLTSIGSELSKECNSSSVSQSSIPFFRGSQ